MNCTNCGDRIEAKMNAQGEGACCAPFCERCGGSVVGDATYCDDCKPKYVITFPSDQGADATPLDDWNWVLSNANELAHVCPGTDIEKSLRTVAERNIKALGGSI